jgi:hypothetical protein
MLLNASIDTTVFRHLICGRPGNPHAQPVLHQAAHFLLARGAIPQAALHIRELALGEIPDATSDGTPR